MGYDVNDFQDKLEKELENYVGGPLPDDDEFGRDNYDGDGLYDNYDYDDDESGDKKNRIKTIIISAVLVLTVVLVGIYGGFTYYYHNRFYKGTVINNTDCGRLTVSQAEEKIRKNVENYELKLKFRGGEKKDIRSSDIDLEYVPDDGLTNLRKSQSPFLWPKGIFGGSKKYNFKANITYDENKLDQIVSYIPQLQDENMQGPEDAKVEFLDNKFQVTEEVRGNKLDKGKALGFIKKAIDSGQKNLSLEKAGAYEEPKVLSDDKNLQTQAAQLNELTASSITYQLPQGDQVLDGNTLRQWLFVDDNGNYSKDDDVWNQHIREYVQNLAESVDTYDVDTKFQATGLGEITVKGKFGFQINQEAEAAQLLDELSNHTVTTRKPAFSQEAPTYENNGFGNSYVEIDLSRQHVWVYKDGALAVDTGCVSGKMTSDRWTPPGIFHLTFKKSPSVLRGAKRADGTYEYESPVTYWMPFNGGIGLHDATWRTSGQFGTNIYKNRGSHGCINLPLSKAKAIYEIIDESMPIICYYSETYNVAPAEKKADETKEAPTASPDEEKKQDSDTTKEKDKTKEEKKKDTPAPTKTPPAPTKVPTPAPTDPPVTETPTPTDPPAPTNTPEAPSPDQPTENE